MTCRGRRHEVSERAGCGKTARPVRRAATGNGAMAWTEAPASRKPPATATPHVLPPPRQSSTLPDSRCVPAACRTVGGGDSGSRRCAPPRSLALADHAHQTGLQATFLIRAMFRYFRGPINIVVVAGFARIDGLGCPCRSLSLLHLFDMTFRSKLQAAPSRVDCVRSPAPAYSSWRTDRLWDNETQIPAVP